MIDAAEQEEGTGARRLCRVLDLVDDAALIAEYEQRHAAGAVWPDVIDHIRSLGVLKMEIWRAADRLVMIMEVTAVYPRPGDTSHVDAVARWEDEMSAYQRPLTRDRAEKWLPMTRIFSLDEQ